MSGQFFMSMGNCGVVVQAIVRNYALLCNKYHIRGAIDYIVYKIFIFDIIINR